jgi:multicomponent Na+:H+ antiporter subunit F
MTEIALAMLTVAILLAAIRVIRGPALPDRVVALDLISTVAIGVIAAYAVLTRTAATLDVAIVVSLITFAATVAFAFFLEHETPGGKDED